MTPAGAGRSAAFRSTQAICSSMVRGRKVFREAPRGLLRQFPEMVSVIFRKGQMVQEYALGREPPQERLAAGGDRLIEPDESRCDGPSVIVAEEVRIRRPQDSVPGQEKVLPLGVEQIRAVGDVPKAGPIVDGGPGEDVGVPDAQPRGAAADRAQHPGRAAEPRRTDREPVPLPHHPGQISVEVIRVEVGEQETVQVGKAAGTALGGLLHGGRKVGKPDCTPPVQPVHHQPHVSIPEIEPRVGGVEYLRLHGASLCPLALDRPRRKDRRHGPLTAKGWRRTSPGPYG